MDRIKQHDDPECEHEPSRKESRQVEVPACSTRAGDDDTEQATQSIETQQTVAGASNDNSPVATTNTRMNDAPRAFRMRTGREELIVIGTQAWDTTIMDRLTNLQQKIVRLLMLGMSHKQVAAELGIQPQTVANTTSTLYKSDDGIADTLEQLVSKLCCHITNIKPE